MAFSEFSAAQESKSTQNPELLSLRMERFVNCFLVLLVMSVWLQYGHSK